MSAMKASRMLLLVMAAVLSCSPDRGDQNSPVTPLEGPRVEAAAKTSYYRITEVLPDPVPMLELSQVVGLLGGELTVAGHKLTVPAGAVSTPTLFTVRAMNNGYIELELSAVVDGLLGVINVGESGFDKPVTVTMTYARATNVTDPQRLKVIRLKDNGRHEILPTTVGPNGLTISAKLDHFSRYAMISD